MKIDEKEERATMKKNLEGNFLTSKNSFSVLSNYELICRAGKMGVETTSVDPIVFDIMKDLELARNALETKKY